ncbi:MAG: BON domain-containing protein [Verrucomicrobiota bacterium]
MRTLAQCLGVTLTAATIYLTGCTMMGGNQMTGSRTDDQAVSSMVKNKLDTSPIYKFNQVTVSTYDRVVQLSGWVDTQDQKNGATDLAKQVPDVRDVINNIQVKSDTTRHAEARPANPPAEAWAGSTP